jgi:hypothetical protein
MAVQIAAQILKLIPMGTLSNQVLPFVQNNMPIVTRLIAHGAWLTAVYVYNRVSETSGSPNTSIAENSNAQSSSASAPPGGNGGGSSGDDDDDNADSDQKKLNNIRKKSVVEREESQRRHPIYARGGGERQAHNDFKSLSGKTHEYQLKSGGYALRKDLKNNMRAILRDISTDGRITMEIQKIVKGVAETLYKIRY